MAPRPAPRDIVPAAETVALRAAAIAAEERSRMPAPKRIGEAAPRLTIHDPTLAVWLLSDGRAVRDEFSRVHLRLTEAYLPGLNDVDAQDVVVLTAYMKEFAEALTAAGYRAEIVTAKPPRDRRRHRAPAGARPTSQTEEQHDG